MGNWSSRSSPSNSKSPGEGGTTPLTAPSTPMHTPLASPFASRSSNRIKSPPSSSIGLQFYKATCSTEPLDYKVCTPMPCTVEMQRAVAVSPVYSPSELSESSCSSSPARLHRASVKHYVVSSQDPNDRCLLDQHLYRQHSTSTDTITESESINYSDMSSPTSTLPLSHSSHPASDPGNLKSPSYIQQGIYDSVHSPSQYVKPMYFKYPYSKPMSSQPSFNVASSPPLCNWNSDMHGIKSKSDSVSYNELSSDRESSKKDYFSSNSFRQTNSDKEDFCNIRSHATTNKSEFIPNINNTNQSPSACSWRSSRSSTPASLTNASLAAPTHSPAQNYPSEGSAKVFRRQHLEPVRVAPPPPTSSHSQVAPPVTTFLCGPPPFLNPPVCVSSPCVTTVTNSASVKQTTTTVPLSATPSARTNAPTTITGAKHKASLHFVPSPPHNTHLLLSSPNKGTVEQSDRSYTSVNLRLRQPSSEPHPSVDIKSTGNCLTYSTSSLDRRQGSRSSLQISIGPSGGSISAMRTNLSSEVNKGSNTAFHIQYRSGDDAEEDAQQQNFPQPPNMRTDADLAGARLHNASHPSNESPVPPQFVSSSVFKNSPSVDVRTRPQSWYVYPNVHHADTNSSYNTERARRNSLPESGNRFSGYYHEQQQVEEGVVIEEQEAHWDRTDSLYLQGYTLV